MTVRSHDIGTPAWTDHLFEGVMERAWQALPSALREHGVSGLCGCFAAAVHDAFVRAGLSPPGLVALAVNESFADAMKEGGHLRDQARYYTENELRELHRLNTRYTNHIMLEAGGALWDSEGRHGMSSALAAYDAGGKRVTVERISRAELADVLGCGDRPFDILDFDEAFYDETVGVVLRSISEANNSHLGSGGR